MSKWAENFLLKMQNAKSKKLKTKLRDKNGRIINVSYEDKERLGTDDVYMVACEVINHMPHNIYFTEDERYIKEPKRYLVKPNERIVIPHTRMIVSDDFNSPEIKCSMIYGEINKGV